ncbi:hypothetical protein B840_12595 (plasmid) [Corynebacterium marinum DSM 44953]|uniref:Uncharacterized protein n=1 Tax=Corynebacterium marinum DSM 44953 TaxID=1224162 RepID=A0A0B6TJE9_9CORY|nr:hypothetical protein B840_12595 [Corynebacterium marinum DSM 44953]
MPVQCCPRPADHARGVFGTTAFGSLLGDDSELAVDHLWIHRWSAEAGALGFRCGDAGVDAFGDQFSFVLSQSPQHPEHQPTRGRLRVDAVRDRLNLHLSFAQQVHRVEYVEQGSAQPVDAPHHHRVTGLGIGEKFLHSGTLDRILRPGGDIAEDITVLDPGGDQGVVLKCRILTDGGYPGVAQQSHTHHHASLNPSMEEGGTLFGETGW